MSKKFYTAKNDRIFKAIFCNEEDTYLLKEFLSRLLNKNVRVIRFLRNELIINNVLSKEKRVDLLCLVDDTYVHIEINTEKNNKYLHVRNFTYFTEIYDKKTLRGKEYKYDDEYLHIDLSYNMNNKDSLFSSYYLMDKNNKKYIENFEVQEYNMDRLKKFWYNENIENINKYLHLIILDLNKDELEKLLKLDLSERDVLFVKTYYEKTKELNDDEYYTSQISYMEDVWRCANTEKRIAYEEGIEQGIEQGKKDAILETAKKFKSLNITAEQISSATGLSIEEINNL